MKSFLLFGLFGVISGVVSCSQEKEKLLNRLDVCDKKLNEAVGYSAAHALDFHKSVYETLFLRSAELQKSIHNLRQETEEVQMSVKIDKFEKIVSSKIQNPNEHETSKASAIYLAAMKQYSLNQSDHIHSARIIKHIKMIVGHEIRIAQLPKALESSPPSNVEKSRNYMNLALDKLYAELEIMVSGSAIPSFVDFYELANKTRTQIAFYDRHYMDKEANKLRAELEQYDNATLALARAWPINTEAAVDHYFQLAEAHHIFQIALEQAEHPPKTIKAQLMEIVDSQERKVTSAVVKLERDSLNYYAKRLLALHDYFNHTRSLVQSLPDDVDESHAYWEKQNVDSMVTTVTMEIRDNAPEEKVKARALYLAATKSLARPDDSVLSPSELKTEVQAIVDKENSYLSKHATVNDRRLSLSYRTDLHDMVSKLEKLLKNHVIPGPEENRKLEERAVHLLLYYKKSGNAQRNILSLEKDIHAFHDETLLLNSLLPIDSADKIAQFFNAALAHFETAAKIQRRFMKIPV